MIKTGFASQIITPQRGIGLAGYFNKPTGVLTMMSA